MAGAESTELASIYRLTATSFRMSAEAVRSHYESHHEDMPGNHRAMPYYFLVSQACELLLKAALLKRGIAEPTLRKARVRHDLLALLQELEQYDVRITPDAALTLGKLSRQHRDHDLRYTALLADGVSIATPAPEDVENLLDELLICTRLRTSS
jgi:HEPN domain-containing protein